MARVGPMSLPSSVSRYCGGGGVVCEASHRISGIMGRGRSVAGRERMLEIA